MNKFYMLFFLLFFVHVSSAGFVERTVTYTNYSDYRIAKIELTPYPLDEFDNPGYFVEETIPATAIIQSIDTKINKTIGNKLQLIKFMPSESDKRLIYQVRIPVDAKYEIYGTYLDESRNFGIVKQVTESTITPETPITVSYKVVNDTIITKSSSEVSRNDYTTPTTTLSAQITQYLPESVDTTNFLPIALLLIGIFGLVYVLKMEGITVFDVIVRPDGNVIVNKKSMGIVQSIRLNINTTHKLIAKISGDISKIVVGFSELPDEKQKSYLLTIKHDGKEHKGNVVFIVKKKPKNNTYKLKK